MITELKSGDTISPQTESLIKAACIYGDIKEINKNLELGADINGKDSNGNTALIHACYHHREKAVELLISGKADVNLSSSHGLTPLGQAATCGHMKICELLLQAGANKSIKCKGKTAAEMASDGFGMKLASFIESWGHPKAASGKTKCD